VRDELLEERLVHDGVERAQQREDRDATLARDARAGVGRLVLLLFEVDLEPLTATRVDRAFEGDLLVLAGLNNTPGERTSWLTTTRSVPLMMNVPCSVMIGKSPMKTVCSLISPVSELRKRARTKDRLGVRGAR